MEHFLYDVHETDNQTDTCSADMILQEFSSKTTATDLKVTDKASERTALVISYDLNFKSSSLSKILDFYNIPTRKMKKMDKAEAVVDYELEPANAEIVEKRKRYWNWINELREDEYFKKYIAIDIEN